MASYDYDSPGRDRSTRHYYREERRDRDRDRDRAYLDPQDSYLRPTSSSRDLVPRHREGSDLSVEEVRREFPPPGYSSRDVRRARSAEPGYYDYDDRRSAYSRDEYDRDYDRRPRRKAGDSIYYEEEEKKRARMLNKQEKIIAAIAGAALAVGGKEMYDRREAKQEGLAVHRNPLLSAGLGAAGALAGYQGAEAYNKYAGKEERKSTLVVHKGRDGHVSEYYSDDDSDPRKEKGHKNFLEHALAAAGLGGAVKALTGGNRDDRSDTRSHRSGDGKRGENVNKIQKAAMASLIAGATEAFRVSKEPGGWKGEKAKRVLTAAAGAAAIDSAQSDSHGKVGLAESVIGGLVGNRIVNGSKRNIEEDAATGRSRSRSRARSQGPGGGGVSGLAALATAGLGAFGAKKIMDKREESRGRSASYDSRDESPDRHRQRSRSRSIVDKARNSLAKMGLVPKEDDRDRSRSRSRRPGDYDESPRGSGRRNRGGYDDDYDDGYHRGGRSRGGKDDYDDNHRDRSRSGRRRASSKSGSESSLGDSDEDEKRAKKMRGKQILTTGLAAVATIHAAHNVYQSMEKRNSRRRAVREGRLSPEEAKKLKSKALLQDAASVGIAALGIKGAFSELKEAREMTHECHEWQEKKQRRHERRLERQKHQRQITNGDHYDGDAEGDYYSGRRRADNWSSSAPPRADRYADGPRYADGNPYGALPAPPVGDYDRRR